MLHSRSRILAEATSKLIKIFSTMFFPNLYYTFITYDGRKSNEKRVTANEQKLTSKKQNLTSKEENITNNKQKVTSKK